MIRNILWGVDGVLFDTHPAIIYAFSKALSEMGLAIALNEIDGLTRQSVDRCLSTLSRRFKLDPGQLQLRFAEAYLKVPAANQPPMPGIRDLCALVLERGGVNLIVTQRSLESTQQLLDTHGLDKYFAGIFSAGQAIFDEPYPFILDAAIHGFGLDRAETMLVSTDDRAVKSGRVAGLHSGLFGGAGQRIDCHSQLLERLEKEE